ncbi:MAG: hypothetical protein ACQESH_02035 [Campylobacterota bacterium]
MSDVEVDRFELQLQQYTKQLQDCQEKNGLKSCFDCKDLLECKIRSDYVKAVYQSMNKGEGGGFEF